jgi:hypothetical protein
MTDQTTAPEPIVEEQQQAAPQADAPAGPDLNVNDLTALKNIIDVATQRGAFKAAEMEAVGKVYNRLNLFLESVTKKD